ncbi:CALM [Mytilus coruscus]|uniref:CALM n=1 Tax=Mytilus coruscus TaxID=42192 RepID=A0A6J8E710_MYTCO|nr:CALM [Mytilus coruscus]
MAEDLSKEEMEEIRKTFNILDKNHDGRLSKTELIKGIHLLKVNPTEVEAEDIMTELDLDGDGLVTWEEYLKALSAQIKKQAYEEQLFLQAFKKFDKDNSGFIDKEELKSVLKKKGAKWTDDDLAFLDDLFLEADEDGNGRVEYKEFVKTFCDQ